MMFALLFLTRSSEEHHLGAYTGSVGLFDGFAVCFLPH